MVIAVILIVFGLIFVASVSLWVYINGWKKNALFKIVIGGVGLIFTLLGSMLLIRSCVSKKTVETEKYKVKRKEAERIKQEKKERDLANKKNKIKKEEDLAGEKSDEIEEKKKELDDNSAETNNKINSDVVVDDNKPNPNISKHVKELEEEKK